MGSSGGRRRRHQRRRKAPLWARLLVWTGAIVAVVSLGSVLAVKAVMWRYDSSIHRANLLGTARTHRGATVTGPLNVLVIGMSDLWQAIRDDTVDSFVLAHPALVNQLHPSTPVPGSS
jgi:hypothetical protein